MVNIDDLINDIESDQNLDINNDYSISISVDFSNYCLGVESEKQKMNIISAMIRKRKKITQDINKKLDESILYCCNMIHAIGDKYIISASQELKEKAGQWRKKMMDFELQKVIEKKDQFRDTLFLRNELMKTWINYFEMKNITISL